MTTLSFRSTQFDSIAPPPVLRLFWLNQFTTFAWVTYPSAYDTFLAGINVFIFNLSRIVLVDCLARMDFYLRLVIITLGPLVLLVPLEVTFSVKRCSGGDDSI